MTMLVVCESLIETGSSMKTAERLGLTEAAISHNLKQLRALFDDPLFVRSKNGMSPTPRGTEIATEISAVLAQMRGMLEGESRSCDPHREGLTFKLGIQIFMSVEMDIFINELTQAYPNIKIHNYVMDFKDGFEMLENGKIDLFIGDPGDLIPASLATEQIRDIKSLIVCAAKNELAKHKKLSKKRFIQGPHIRIATAGFADNSWFRNLNKHGLKREFDITYSYYEAALHKVEDSDHILMINENIYELYKDSFKLKVLEPDFSYPFIENKFVWAKRSAMDPDILWVRDQIKDFLT